MNDTPTSRSNWMRSPLQSSSLDLPSFQGENSNSYFFTTYNLPFQFSKGKDKNTPGGFLLSKSSSGQATLLDFALFDHISRLEVLSLISMHLMVNTLFQERARETSKSSRVLTKLFPTKVLIKAPTESKALGEWTKRIGKDQRRMKFQQNKAAIIKVLERNGITCEDKLRCRLLKQQVNVSFLFAFSFY